MRKLALVVVLLAAPFAAAQPKGKPVTVKVPPLPPSTEELTLADPASAAWVPSEKVGLPAGAQVALIGADPVSTGPLVYVKARAGWALPPHWHVHTEYTTLVSGKGVLVVDGKSREVGPGSYVVLPGKTRHSFTCDAGGECLLIVRRSGPADWNWVASPK